MNVHKILQNLPIKSDGKPHASPALLIAQHVYSPSMDTLTSFMINEGFSGLTPSIPTSPLCISFVLFVRGLCTNQETYRILRCSLLTIQLIVTEYPLPVLYFNCCRLTFGIPLYKKRKQC